MNSSQTPDVDSPTPPRLQRRRLILRVLLAVAVLYVVIAYIAIPWLWDRYEDRRPWLDEVPGITETRDKIPGDPLNVSLIGTEPQLAGILARAGWDRADALGLRSDMRIATDTVLHRSYDDAPVSSLYLFGRKEDLAYEKPSGDDPRRRHHVRFWKAPQSDHQGRPVWFGSATFDERVGLSHTTGEITHHIASDIDTERDFLMHSLSETGGFAESYYVKDFQKEHEGRNGGGDPWHTDGQLSVGVIAEGNSQ